MKRPISHFLVPLACLLMLPFCLQPGSALGGDKTRSHAAGSFQMDIGGNDKGWVQSTEGGSSSSETVNEKLGPVPKQQTIAPVNRNVAPLPQRATITKPACAHPPCGLGQQQEIEDKKDSQSETAEEMSMRLQQQQERRAKEQETLSNVQKKNSDTESGIISNMK